MEFTTEKLAWDLDKIILSEKNELLDQYGILTFDKFRKKYQYFFNNPTKLGSIVIESMNLNELIIHAEHQINDYLNNL